MRTRTAISSDRPARDYLSIERLLPHAFVGEKVAKPDEGVERLPIAVQISDSPFDRSLDRLTNGLGIANQHLVGNSQDSNPSAAQLAGSLGLVIDHPFSSVMAFIQLDRELQFCGVEIDDVAPDWMLTAKLPLAESARAQPSPDSRFRTRWFPPHATREATKTFARMRHEPEDTW